MPRTATIGPAIYQRVNELIGEGKNRTEAFAQVAQERGQQAGTVAANYYRTARSQGETRRTAKNGRRRRAKAGTRKPAQTASPQSRAQATIRAQSTSDHEDITQIATQIATLTQQLIKQIQDRDARLRALLG